MKKNKLFLLLALLLTAATGAWATNYTTLAVGDVIKVGDTFSPTDDGVFNNNGVSSGNTYTLMRADIDNDYNVTEKTDGAYYVFKFVSEMSSPYIHFDKAFAVTAISDGLEVTNIDNMKGKLFYTLALHGSSAPAATGYSVSLKDGVKDADKWTVKVGEGLAQALPIGGLKGDGSETVTLQYNGRLKVKGVKATSDAAPAEATYTLLSAATTADCGKVVCAAGHLHDAKTAVPDGCTAVGILGKVTETGHGLILALQNATNQTWNTINGWASASYAGTTLKVLPDDAARGTNLTSYTALGETAVSNWAVAQQSDYDAIFTNLGSKTGDSYGTTYDGNVNAYITTGVGGSAISGHNWSATEDSEDANYACDFESEYWNGIVKTASLSVRPVLGFGGEAGEQSAKTPATVTTAPTGAAIVGVGKTTALVSGGAAEGGTMMYKVTTENTKPASTDGFSDAVPTAQSITASGKVYVWYYVKGDETHTDSEIAATAIEVPVADVVWDATNVTDLSVSGTGEYEMDGVKLSGNANQIEAKWQDYGNPTMDGMEFSMRVSGGYTFTAPDGKAFTKIEMKALGPGGWSSANLGTGWAYNNPTVTWTGSAASTVGLLTGADKFKNGTRISYIAFTLVNAE